MAYDRFLIAPINEGLQKNIRPFLISDDAFAELNNAYIFRGRIQKRFGGRLLNQTTPYNNRLRVKIGQTLLDGSFAAGLLPAGGYLGKVGQAFSVGTTIFTVYQANGAMLSTNPAATGTFNVATITVTIAGATPLTDVYFYMAEPVMGLVTKEDSVGLSAINEEATIAFDTRFAYKFVAGAWSRVASAIPTTSEHWTGDATNFFWGYNYRGTTSNQDRLFVTNNVDPVRSITTSTWTDFKPWINQNNGTVETALLVYGFDNRLLLFNTQEKADPAAPTATYPQRCRFSAIGNPMYSDSVNLGPTNGAGNLAGTVPGGLYGLGQQFSVGTDTFVVTTLGTPAAMTPLPGSIGTGTFNTTTGAYTIVGSVPATDVYFYANADAWKTDITGRGGGFVDASTREAIISCRNLQDRLIVFFERSTWELVKTGNKTEPFIWRRVNSELGVESPFSLIPFDRIVLGIGDVGVHACSGNNVERIDGKIPDDIFQIRNTNNGVLRVQGIRDYYTEYAYWTLPSVNSTTWQDRVLLFNYRNSSWAYNDDSITCFGYFHQQGDFPTWADINLTWQEMNTAWNSGTLQKNFRDIVAGNQVGFVWFVDSGENYATRNAPVMQITNITNPAPGVALIQAIDHNLKNNDYILIENALGNTYFNNKIYQITVLTPNTFIISDPDIPLPFDVYTGAGTLTRVSEINILTKQYNFYMDKSRNAAVAKVDFYVDSSEGDMTVDCFSTTNPAVIDTKTLETQPYVTVPIEANAIRLWHPIYTSIEGEVIQLKIYQSDEQLRDPNKSLSNFTLHGMLFYAYPTTNYLR